MKKRILLGLAAVAASGVVLSAQAGSAQITVSADRPGPAISPDLYGIFFEDINLSADGGIYPEMIRNRSFEDSERTPDSWKAMGSGGTKAKLSLDQGWPVAKFNQRSMKVELSGAGRGGVANGGYWGVAVKQGERYTLKLFARAEAPIKSLSARIEGPDGTAVAEARVEGLTPEWKEYTVEFNPTATRSDAVLALTADGPGTFWLDFVSLLPNKTWKDHGLRPDLGEMLLALKPAYVRFPGGCWVEGDNMAEAYRWKQTIGPLYARRTQNNIWGYKATHGLGYHEYLQMCEDLGAAAMFVVNCGMSHRENVPMDQMGEFVQDALDALEYALGPVESKWGAERAKRGHPKPFPLKYLEIGNENGGPAYHERYALIADAVKAKYPQVQLIANVWSGVPGNRKLEIIDEHYYSTPEFFIGQAHKYDKYDRNGPRVYVGEFACTQGSGKGNQRAAVGEAAFMTGMERNSDVVVMASYAPLFVHEQHRRWNPDLIVHNNSNVYGIPSYYAQQMFSHNRGDVVLPVQVVQPPAVPEKRFGGIGVGSWLTESEFKDVRVEQDGKVLYEQNFVDGAPDWKGGAGKWAVVEGAYRQSTHDADCRAFGPKGADWTNYTYALKARRVAGQEGFLVLFHVKDGDNHVCWNVGGWGNGQHGLELVRGGGRELIAQKGGKLETGRWYDVKIEVSQERIRCSLDGKLIHDVAFPTKSELIYATASRDQAQGEIIVKAVSTANEATETSLVIEGAKPGRTARVIELAADDPWAENSMSEPNKVAPKTREAKLEGNALKVMLPPWSVSVFRIPAK